MNHQWRPPQDGLCHGREPLGFRGLPSVQPFNRRNQRNRTCAPGALQSIGLTKESGAAEIYPVAIALITLHAPGKLVQPAVVTHNLRQDGLASRSRCLRRGPSS